MSTHHYLKTETRYFQDIENGLKRFEWRKNDRSFQPYDFVHLEESVEGVKTGRVIGPLQINYILAGPGFGIPNGYCIFCWPESSDNYPRNY